MKNVIEWAKDNSIKLAILFAVIGGGFVFISWLESIKTIS